VKNLNYFLKKQHNNVKYLFITLMKLKFKILNLDYKWWKNHFKIIKCLYWLVILWYGVIHTKKLKNKLKKLMKIKVHKVLKDKLMLIKNKPINKKNKMITINKIKIVNNHNKTTNKIKIKLYKINQYNILSCKTLTIHLDFHYLSINTLKIYKIKFSNLKDKMLKYLSYVLVLYMDVDRIHSIHSLKLHGCNNLINCHIWMMEIILYLQFIWKI
jgi:hypothetical protein